MDVRLTIEQRELRDAAARLGADLGPGSVQALDDRERVERLEKAMFATGWRSLRTDDASGVEVALISEELGRTLVDVPFLGPVLADDLCRGLTRPADGSTLAVGSSAYDVGTATTALAVEGSVVSQYQLEQCRRSPDLTRCVATVRDPHVVGSISEPDSTRWRALALAATTADLVGAARGAHSLASEYARTRQQYGRAIGSNQAVGHMLAGGLALLEGCTSVLRHAAWAVDELEPPAALRAAVIAKLYCARAARSICEDAIQVHGGIGNAWECLAHLFLRRVLASSALFPVTLKEVGRGLS